MDVASDRYKNFASWDTRMPRSRSQSCDHAVALDTACATLAGSVAVAFAAMPHVFTYC